jgi:F-type H+-transporting ATPase subunit gamma
MAKARAIVKRRKAVRNIRKITKTMQMIATAKFQKSLKRAVGTKAYTLAVRELVRELASTLGGTVEHPLLRPVAESARTNREAVVVLTSNRGLAGAYNGSVIRTASAFMRQQEAAGKQIDLYVAGKKGVSYFNFRKRPIVQRLEISDPPRAHEAHAIANTLMERFIAGEVDAVHVAFMNFISTGVQKPEVVTLLPLSGLKEHVERMSQQVAEKEAQIAAGMLDAKRTGGDVAAHAHTQEKVIYEFSPNAKELLDELLPLTVRTAMFQGFMDAATSEHVARMVSMKSATDNADKMVKALTMQYNRARQSQITTELSEIMGGVEAMKG